MILPPIRKTYGARTVLDIGELEIPPGAICAVLGSNGSGKSTFAKILAGVLRADSGPVSIPGNPSVGYLPQKPFAFRRTVRGNLLLAADDSRRADELLSAFGLSALADQRAKNLSGGETARMVLARLLMRDRDLLILDEPTAAMDIGSTGVIEDRILSCRDATGCAVLLITHSVKQAGRISDEVLFLSGGKLAERGETKRILTSPETGLFRTFLEYGDA